MENAYYDVPRADSYGSFAGVERQNKTLKRNDIDKFLSEQDAYTLHANVRRRFKRRKTLAFRIDDLWQADLVDLSRISSSNDGFRYLLTSIDVLSKYARVAILKTKSADAVTNAFRTFLNRNKKPTHLQTDKGTEFLNSKFQQMLKDEGIKHYTSQNEDIKCAIVERWHRTLLAKLYRYFTRANTIRYIDIIQDLVQSYNDTYHSAIKMTPSQVNVHNELDVRDTLFNKSAKDKKKKKTPTRRFAIGDTVRISGVNRHFPTKGYHERWSRELFKVTKIYNTDPITYGLTDLADEPIIGKFYAPELIKAVKEVFTIEKVLKTRKKKDGKTEYFVKWLDYPDKFNSWTDHINARHPA